MTEHYTMQEAVELENEMWRLDSVKTYRDMLAALINAAVTRKLAEKGIGAESGNHVKAMVDRFLGWKLPQDFYPDSGISFKPPSNPERWPIGTNLLNAQQADQMIGYIAAPFLAEYLMLKTGIKEPESVTRKLAEKELEVAGLREVLEETTKHIGGGIEAINAYEIAIDTLSTPSSTDALDAIVAASERYYWLKKNSFHSFELIDGEVKACIYFDAPVDSIRDLDAALDKCRGGHES